MKMCIGNEHLYIELYKVIEIVSKWKHALGCMAAHAKANVALMSGK
jgi:hypothetical protein